MAQTLPLRNCPERYLKPEWLNTLDDTAFLGRCRNGAIELARHTYETILYVLEGKGYSVVEDQRVDWEAGDAVYIPVWAWHHHVNLDSDRPAKYIACENAPMLQNMGMLALREEAD